jgi:kinetochore protein NDC80
LSTTQIERLESDLANLRADLSTSLQALEQKEVATNVQYDDLVSKATSLREELHSSIERCLNDVIRFKLHVQKGLEELEGFVVEEVEMELGGDEEQPMDQDRDEQMDD